MVKVNFNWFANAGLFNVHLLHFNLIFRQDPPNVITEFHDHSILIYRPDNSTVLFLKVDVLDVKEHVITFNEFLIISNFHHFIPNVQTKDFKFSFPLPKDFKVVKRNLFRNLPDSES